MAWGAARLPHRLAPARCCMQVASDAQGALGLHHAHVGLPLLPGPGHARALPRAGASPFPAALRPSCAPHPAPLPVQILIYILCLTMPAFFGCIGHLSVTSFGLIAAVMGLNVSETVLFWLQARAQRRRRIRIPSPTAHPRVPLQVAHWVVFGGTWLIHMYLARFYKVCSLQLRAAGLARGQTHLLPPPSPSAAPLQRLQLDAAHGSQRHRHQRQRARDACPLLADAHLVG